MEALPPEDVQRLIPWFQALIPGGNTPEDFTQVYEDPVFQAALGKAGFLDPHHGKTEAFQEEQTSQGSTPTDPSPRE